LHKDIQEFFKEIESVYRSKMPFVAFRKPDEDFVTAFVQRTQELYELKSYKESGFVFAPFGTKEKKVLFPMEKCDSFKAAIGLDDSLENCLVAKRNLGI
jgi:isochorismate synthase